MSNKPNCPKCGVETDFDGSSAWVCRVCGPVLQAEVDDDTPASEPPEGDIVFVCDGCDEAFTNFPAIGTLCPKCAAPSESTEDATTPGEGKLARVILALEFFMNQILTAPRQSIGTIDNVLAPQLHRKSVEDLHKRFLWMAGEVDDMVSRAEAERMRDDAVRKEQEQTAQFVRGLGDGPQAVIPPDCAEFLSTAILGQSTKRERWRPEVRALAELAQAAIDHNEPAKGDSWQQMTVAALLGRCQDEVFEAQSGEHVLREIGDAAAFLAFAAIRATKGQSR